MFVVSTVPALLSVPPTSMSMSMSMGMSMSTCSPLGTSDESGECVFSTCIGLEAGNDFGLNYSRYDGKLSGGEESRQESGERGKKIISEQIRADQSRAYSSQHMIKETLDINKITVGNISNSM